MELMGTSDRTRVPRDLVVVDLWLCNTGFLLARLLFHTGIGCCFVELHNDYKLQVIANCRMQVVSRAARGFNSGVV
jgi:hypothetical protein